MKELFQVGMSCALILIVSVAFVCGYVFAPEKMTPVVTYVCYGSLGVLALQILQYLRVKISRNNYDSAPAGDPVELDPREDSMLFGLAHCIRLELFDMWQRKYLKISKSRYKKRNKPEKELKPLQQKIMSSIEEESNGKFCGTLIKEIEEDKEVKANHEQAQKKYIDAQLLYPEGCDFPSVLLLLGKAYLLLGIFSGVSYFIPVEDEVPVWILFLPVLPWVMSFYAEKTLSSFTERAEQSIELMREKWANQKMKRADDEEGNERNVAILGAVGMIALEHTQFQSFAGTLPSAVSSSSSTCSGSGCSQSSCTSCGGGGGGSCGGGCGGCGGG